MYTYYLRLRSAGKRPKVAIIAAMHKLLAAIYSVAKHRRPFVPIISPPIVHVTWLGGAIDDSFKWVR